jgi:hypothetical protein
MSLSANKPLELTVNELWDKALGPTKKEGGRPVNLVAENHPVRCIPLSVISTAKAYLAGTNDVTKATAYIINSFFIYRACVCENMFAPLVQSNGIYEWPIPATFTWEDMDAVMYGGELIGGPIIDESSKVIISYKKGKKVEETTLDLGGEELEQHTRVRDLIPGQEDLPNLFRFSIPDLSKVGFIFSQSWQQSSLRYQISPLRRLYEDRVKNELSYEDTRKKLEVGLEIFIEPPTLPIGRYSTPGETSSDMMSLFFEL